MRIFLIGFMGAGKTVVGRHLAEFMKVDFVDLDEKVEKNSNLSVAKIFGNYGEAEFRRLESEALKSTLHMENLVVSTGGGTVLSEWNRQALKERNSLVVYLQAEVQTILERLESDDSRPLLKGNKQDKLHKILSERRNLYEEIADFKIVTDEKTPCEIAKNIVSLIV